MQKGFCPKQGKSLKNYAIFRFSCKPSVTISSVAKTVTQKVPSPETRINTVFFGTSKPRGTIPTRSRQSYSKQVCLWDLAQIICIVFIIQVAWAI